VVCLMSLIGDVVFLIGMFAGLFVEFFGLLHLCLEFLS